MPERRDENPALLISEAQWSTLGEALGFSNRELQIVRCLFDGKKEPVIGPELGISPHTVHTHLVRMYRKLGVSDRCQLLLRVFGTYLAQCSPQEAGGRRA